MPNKPIAADLPKSILDGVPIKDTSAPHFPSPNKLLSRVGACPHCGAPIYGMQSIFENDDSPIKYSCDCKQQRKDLSNTTRRT